MVVLLIQVHARSWSLWEIRSVAINCYRSKYEEELMQTDLLEGFRLSPIQKRIWALQNAEPARPYRSHCAIVINGDLDDNRLNQAISKVVSRHEILRTTFYRTDNLKTAIQ